MAEVIALATDNLLVCVIYTDGETKWFKTPGRVSLARFKNHVESQHSKIRRIEFCDPDAHSASQPVDTFPVH